MKKTVLSVTFLLMLNLNASDNYWTQDTKALTQESSDKILNAYTEGKETPLKLTFKDDKLSKEALGIEENILVMGASFRFGSTTETLENTKGTKDESYVTTGVQLFLGKDFTLWHEQYTQPTRLYMSFGYNYLSTDVSTLSYTFGLRENMEYWPLYSSEKYTIFPTLSYEIGNTTLQRSDLTIRGLTTEASAGVTYKRGNFEYFANFNYTSVTWDYPMDGIIDNSGTLGVSVGLNYKLMYGDFQ